MIGDLAQVRAPVAVRFAVPIALYGVDDAGFCDASFWGPQPKSTSQSDSHNENRQEQIQVDAEPTLASIAATIIQWLEGGHVANTAADVSIDTTDDHNNGDNGDSMRDRQQRWKEAEQHATKTMDVIQQYAHVRRGTISSSSSVTTTPTVLCSRIEPEWIVPALRPCFLDTKTTTSSTVLDLDWPSLVTEVGPGIYEFDLFSHHFCNALIDEVDAFELSKLPCRRPNTMNKLGLVVNDMGLEPIMTCIVERLLAPMCKALYPQEEICSALDHHHSFVVRYRTKTGASSSSTSNVNGQAANGDNDDGSSGLDMHHDASEATLNVCLGRDDFTSGGLRFCGHHGDANHRKTQLVHSHLKGRAILHLGRHRHGADNITSGERINLIVWARNSAYRGAAAFGNVKIKQVEREIGVPDKLCLSKSNDRDYEEKMKLFVPRSRKIAKLTF